MKEKRQLKRRQLLYYPEVYIRDTDYLIGKLADINQSGLLVTGERKVELDKELPLQVNLPETLYGESRLCLDAVCVRSVKDAQTGRVESGFRVVSITESDRLLVNRLVLEYRIP